MGLNIIRLTIYGFVVTNDCSQTAANSGGRTAVSADAARLWRYVQAAKEGQNGEDCRPLFPNCHTVGI